MDVLLSNPPAGWQVGQTGSTVTIFRTKAKTERWPLLLAGAGAVVIVGGVVAFQVATGTQSFIGALFSRYTVTALLPAVAIYLLSRLGDSQPNSQWSYVLDGTALRVESRYGSHAEEASVARGSILRFHSTTESDPSGKGGDAVFLNATLRDTESAQKESALGVFRHEAEAAWFTSVFEAWNGGTIPGDSIPPEA